MNPAKRFPLLAIAVAAVVTAVGASGSPLGPTSSKILFSSTRDNPFAVPQFDAAEIYSINPDGTGLRRLTENAFGDGFGTFAPDESGRIVFDSSRLRGNGPLNTSDLFLMNANGTGQTFLTRGGSPSWSPDAENIALHASATGSGQPILPFPGAATSDSDIFVLNIATGDRVNLTNSGSIDDDPDWSPNGQRIMFTSHPVSDNANNAIHAEIYVMNADGTGPRIALTNAADLEEERGPDWSPDGARIVYACRKGGPAPGTTVPTFEICTMNADGTNVVRLTTNTAPDLTPAWSPDGGRIVFHRGGGGGNQLFSMAADGGDVRQLTFSPPAGQNLLATWGRLEATPPVVACASPDGAWHGSDVSLECSASDAGSGLAKAEDASFLLATAVPDGMEPEDAQTGSRQVCDMAGNCASAGPIGGNKVDKKTPAIAIAAPADGSSYVLGEAVEAEYACSDDGSGIAACVGGAVVTSSVGTRAFAVDASDAVGNVASHSVEYKVSYAICVLYDQTKARRLGSTIAIRLQLCNAAGWNVSAPMFVLHAVALTRVSDEASGVVEDAGESSADGDFRYDVEIGGTGGYIFNLDTGALSAGTWELGFAVLDDPNLHLVTFEVR